MSERLAFGILCAVLTVIAAMLLALHSDPPIALRLMAVGTGLLSVRLLYAEGGQEPPVAHGSAGFRRPDRTLLHSLSHPLAAGSVVLGRHGGQIVTLSPVQARQHGLIVGGSGTGKSFSFFLPNAVHAHATSCVFIDPKSELWSHTSGYHDSRRYAPAEPDASSAFNWIPLCSDPRLAELAARAIVESGGTSFAEQAWIDMEAAFLSALFSHASTLERPTPLTAYRLFTTQNQERLLTQLHASESPVAREQAEIFSQTTERMRGSIVPVVAARLQFLRDPDIARFTSSVREAPDFRALKVTPHAVYWCLREHDMPRLRPLTSLFFTLLLEQLAVGEGSVPVLLYLDEFAAAGTLPHFDTTIALARGRGVGIWIGLQSLSQLEARYGSANAKTILTNCATRIALSGLDVDTAEYFSRSIGQATVVTERRSRTRRFLGILPGTVQEGSQNHARSLLTADEVRRLPKENLLVITGNRLPMQVQRYQYARLPLTARSMGLGEAISEEFSPVRPVRKKKKEAML